MLIPTLLVLGIAVVLFVIFSGFYTDWLWFASVQKTSVFTTELATKAAMFAAFGLVMAGGIVLAMWFATNSGRSSPPAARSRPVWSATAPRWSRCAR